MNRRWFIVPLLVVTAVLRPPVSAQADQTDNPGVHGTVINTVTHEPIAHAQVYSPDNRFAVMTDDQGRFEIMPQASRDNTILTQPGSLIARKPGFLNQSDRYVPGSEIGEAGQFTIYLTPQAIITGRLSITGEDPPDGVMVQLFRRQIRDGVGHWVQESTVQSNSAGEFRFAGLPAGSYRVGTHEIEDRDPVYFTPAGKVFGYPPVYFPQATSFLRAGTINLAAGQVFEADLSLTRQRYYHVKIPVANPVPASGMTVNVSAEGDGAPGYTLGQGPEHTITGLLPNGTYVVEASTYGQHGLEGSGAVNLTVANAPAESARMTILPGGPISVDVKEQFSKTDPNPQVEWTSGHGGHGVLRGPRRYLNVFLEPASDFRNAYASLRNPARNADGGNDETLAIDTVQPGAYWVRVASSRGYVASVSSGGVDLEQHPLVVGPGGSSPPIEIIMRDDTASFRGTVEGLGAESTATPSASQGSPAYIYCIPEGNGPGQFTQIFVQSNGKFESPQMPPGLYRVLAFQYPQDNLEYRNPEAMRSYESRGQVLRLAPGEEQSLQLQVITEAGADAQ